jgi:hypothetical protein
MSNTIVLRPVGPTAYISVTATSSTAATVSVVGNDQSNYAAFLNTGANPCAVTIAPSAAPAATYPGASAGSFVLPAAMNYPIVLAVPSTSFSVTAICASTKTTDLFVTPVDNQS